SVFGQARYDVTPEIELAAGVRYTNVKKNAHQGQPNFVNSNVTFLLPQGQLLYSNLDEDNASPEVTLTWHPDADTTLYGAFKTGYKTGGIAMPAVVSITDTGAGFTFKPEKSIGGEIGYKARLMDRRLRVEATAYYYK